MTARVVTCNASIVPKTARIDSALCIQQTSMGFDTFRRSVEPVDGCLIQSKYRR